LGAWWNW